MSGVRVCTPRSGVAVRSQILCGRRARVHLERNVRLEEVLRQTQTDAFQVSIQRLPPRRWPRSRRACGRTRRR